MKLRPAGAGHYFWHRVRFRLWREYFNKENSVVLARKHEIDL